MHPILTYSLLALCAGAFVLGFLAEGRHPRWTRLRRFSLPMQLGALALAYLTLRPGRGVDGQLAVASARAASRPVLIELYSNW